MKRQAAEKRGRAAEFAAANYLRLKGWRIRYPRPHAGRRDRPRRPARPHRRLRRGQGTRD
jgi:hypothetical protein